MMMMIWLVWHYAVDDGFVLNMRMMRMAYDRVDIRKQYRVLNGIQLRSVLSPLIYILCSFVLYRWVLTQTLSCAGGLIIWSGCHCILAIVNTLVIFCLKKEKIMTMLKTKRIETLTIEKRISDN